MDGTANDTDVAAEPTDASPLRRFIAVRPARTTLTVTVVLGALAAWIGSVEAPLPAAVNQGQATVPLWRMIAMGAAVLPVLALTSPLAGLELAATQRLRTMQRLYLAGLSTSCAAIYLASCAIVLSPAVVGIIARSWIAWFGLALTAGAVLGWRLSWTLPSAVAIVLWYWGYHEDQRYQWWEFSARPHDDLPSLLLSVTLLVAGLAAYAATPWRRRWLRRS